MRWGILREHIHMLYNLAQKYPEDSLFFKMQVVALYGKITQH